MSPVLACVLALLPGLQAPSLDGGQASGVMPRAPDLAALARQYGDRWTPEAAAYQVAGPAVVAVQTFRRRSSGVSLPGSTTPINEGTGVVIHGEGYVISNAHVAAPDDLLPTESWECRLRFAAEFGGGEVRAEVLRVDREWDLALLRIHEPGPYYALPLAKDDDLLIGERVMAIGAAFGSSLSLTAGLLSGVGRDIRVRGAQGTSFSLTGVIQTDAAINPGNSGGPLVNVRGEWIGLCSATLTGAEGMSFAIPSSRVREVLERRLFVPRVWDGMLLREDSLTVERLHPRGPAADAGLRAGDELTSCDGLPLADAASFRMRLMSARPGAVLQLGYRRQGDAARTAAVMLADEEQRGALGLLGFRASVEEVLLPDPLARGDRRFSVLRVLEVYARSGAQLLGIERGDTIVAVHLTNGANEDGWVPVQSPADLLAHVRGKHFDFDGLNLWWVKPDGTSLKGRLTFDDPELQPSDS